MSPDERDNSPAEGDNLISALYNSLFRHSRRSKEISTKSKRKISKHPLKIRFLSPKILLEKTENPCDVTRLDCIEKLDKEERTNNQTLDENTTWQPSFSDRKKTDVYNKNKRDFDIYEEKRTLDLESEHSPVSYLFFKKVFRPLLPLTELFKDKSGCGSRNGNTTEIPDGKPYERFPKKEILWNSISCLEKVTSADNDKEKRKEDRSKGNKLGTFFMPSNLTLLQSGRDVGGKTIPRIEGSGEENEGVSFRKKRDARRSRYQMAESAPLFRITPIDQTVNPGVEISLKCSSVGSPLPIISWTRDGEPLIPSLRTQVGSFRNPEGEVVSYVNISEVQPRDGGLFRCTSHNSAGMITHTSRLNIYGPPFIRPMTNSSVVAGEDATLWCPVGGYPVPNVSWHFLGQPLPLYLRHEILVNYTLIIRDTKESDNGRYTCIAKSKVGQTAMGDTYLHIMNPPIIEHFNFAPNLKEGRRTHLTCMVTSGDLPITIQWLKDGHHMTHDSDVEQKKITDYSMVLLFKRLSERHSGKYTCVAANSAASTNHTAELNVKVPPKWIISPSDLSVSVGGMVKLQCIARGVPDPLIVWSKSSDVESRNFERMHGDGHRIRISKNGTLTILNVLKSDAATYLCQASNEVGSPLSKIAKISVSARPEITSVGGRVTGHSGGSIELQCEVKGDPPMTLKWHKERKILLQSQRITITESKLPDGETTKSTLALKAVTPTDAGRYECEAVNDHGRHVKNFDLVVLEPPSAPSNLQIEEVTSRSVKISWLGSPSSKVTIQLKEKDSGSWSERGRNVSAEAEDQHHYILSSLAPFTHYSARLFAQNELGVSAPSQPIHFVTEEEAPTGSPRNIRVASLEPGALQISWNPPMSGSVNGAIRGYVIAIRKQNIREDFSYISRPSFQDAFNPSSVEEYTIRGLSPNTLYEVSLRVFNRMGLGPLSSPRIVQSTMFEAPGCSPSGVSCKGDSLSGIRVWWETPMASCTKAPIKGYSILATPTDKTPFYQDSYTREVFTTNLEKNLGMMPASANVSVVVRAYNNLGFSPPSRNIFCHTLDDVPEAPQRLRVVPAEAGSFIAVWLPPIYGQGTVLRYTLYYEYNDKVRHILVQNNDVDSSWKKLSGFQPREKITVWVTASTSVGEGPATVKKTVTLVTSSSYGPFAISSQTLWKVAENFAITLRCRAVGFPRPSISWLKSDRPLNDDLRHQILPGGDLHLIPQSSTNYTCLSKNSLGEDEVVHRVKVLSPPSTPVLRVNEAYRTAINMSVGCHKDGGAPILGFRLYQRLKNGEWKEESVAITSSSSPSNFVLRNLPCGSDISFYATAWNSQGVSPSSEVFVASTRGSLPPRPQPSTLVEVNSSCVTLRPYAWPENGCPVENWKVEGKHENANEWKTIFSRLGREARDVAFCDLQRTEAYLLKIIAYSEAGPTKVTYKVSLQDVYSGWAASEHVQEILMGSDKMHKNWLDAHVVAGIVSAILLTAAIIICSCVLFRKKYYDRDRTITTTTTAYKQKESTRFAHHQENNTSDYHVYSPLPSKKFKGLIPTSESKRKRSRPSLVSYGDHDEDSLSVEDIYPYATFRSFDIFNSAGSVDETLQYGISLHTHSPSSRDCFEGSQHKSEDNYLSRKDRLRSKYKESDVSYPPSKLLKDRGMRPRPNSNCLENSDTLPKDMEKLSEATTMPMSDRNSRDKTQRPRSRLQDGISPMAGVNKTNPSSPVHLNFTQSVPIHTLYAGHVRNSSGPTRNPIPIPSGRLAR